MILGEWLIFGHFSQLCLITISTSVSHILISRTHQSLATQPPPTVEKKLKLARLSIAPNYAP
jgi:hypothetical protein